MKKFDINKCINCSYTCLVIIGLPLFDCVIRHINYEG